MRTRLVGIAFDVVSVLLWTYVVLQLFVVDIDRAFLEWVAPPLVPWLRYKAIFLIVLAVLLWPLVGRWRFVVAVGRVLGFPLWVVVWRVPKFLFRRWNWVVSLFYYNTIANFILEIRPRLVQAAILVAGAVLVADSHSVALVSGGVALLLFGFGRHLLWRARVAVRPASLFGITGDELDAALERVPISGTASTVDGAEAGAADATNDGAKGSSRSDESSDGDAEGETEKLEQVVFYHRLLALMAEFMRRLGRSRAAVWFATLQFLGTILLVIGTFGFIEFGIFRTAPGQYAVLHSANLLDFFYVAFLSLSSNTTPLVLPAGHISEMAAIAGGLCGFLVVGLVGTTFFNMFREGFDAELDDLCSTIEAKVEELAHAVRGKFGVSIEAAVSVLDERKASTTVVIKFFDRLLEDGD